MYIYMNEAHLDAAVGINRSQQDLVVDSFVIYVTVSVCIQIKIKIK